MVLSREHADMTVTSEEKVLDAILMCCMKASEICGWATVDELLSSLTPEQIFSKRIDLPWNNGYHFVFQQLKKSKLCSLILVFGKHVVEAIRYSGIQLTVPGTIQNVRFQHRRSSFKELQYICDGDKNGVIYYTGTSYGEHQWVNPVLAKFQKINVIASSPVCRYTDPKALVSRAYQGTSFAGPRVENGHNCAWWMVDIGQDHQLMCNYYTMRQDGSTAYARSWAFQGSVDGENWTNLRVHDNDQTICKPGQFASWHVHDPTALLPFRFFRVILTGPTAGDTNSWNFCICFIELYGYIR